VISRVSGQLVTKSVDRAEVMTAGGVTYDLAVPLATYESLPATGQSVALHTHLVVKEDGWQLFGFATPYDRQVFRAVLGAKGVGPALALNLLSALSSERLVRAIRERDVLTLQGVPRVGKKKADQLVLDLADKLDELYDAAATIRPAGRSTPAVDEAILGLVRLGYPRADAERSVRSVIESGADAARPSADLIRLALGQMR
jgi:holliday junction DNA helicase RuvA